MASNLPQLHVAMYGWVFLLVASSPREAFGLLMRLNGDDLLSSFGELLMMWPKRHNFCRL